MLYKKVPLPLFTFVYLCLPLFTFVYLCFTFVYLCLPLIRLGIMSWCMFWHWEHVGRVGSELCLKLEISGKNDELVNH